MRFYKSNFLARLVNSYIIDSPEPANISYLWNFGSLLGVCLVVQLLTGIFLSMHFQPHVDFAFNSVEHGQVQNHLNKKYKKLKIDNVYFIGKKYFSFSNSTGISSIARPKYYSTIALASSSKQQISIVKKQIISDSDFHQ